MATDTLVMAWTNPGRAGAVALDIKRLYHQRLRIIGGAG